MRLKQTFSYINIIIIGLTLHNGTLLGEEFKKENTVPVKDRSKVLFFMNSTLSNTDHNNDPKGTEINWLTEELRPPIPILPIQSYNPLFTEGGDAIYGLDIISTISKQNFDLINHNNEVIYNNIIKNYKPLEVGDSSYSIGLDYSQSSTESYDNVLGYETNIFGMYLGMEHKLHPLLRLGGVLNIGESYSDYDSNQSKKEDVFLQGNFYLDYKNKANLRFISFLYFGKINTNLERRYKATLYNAQPLDQATINEKNKSDMSNTYFGINNRIQRIYFVNNDIPFYYKPQFQFNFTYMMQDSISERTTSSDFNGLSIDKLNSYSLNSSIGIAFGKDYILDNNNKFNLELAMDIFTEFGEPYKDLTNDTNFNDRVPVSVPIIGKPNETGPPTGASNTIKSYEFDTITLSTSLIAQYELNTSFLFYGGLNYTTGKYETNIQGNLGFNYNF